MAYIQSMIKKTQPVTEILANIPDIQRDMDNLSMTAIYNSECDYYEKHGHYLLPGVVSIASYKNEEFIVDGQHRIFAYKKLNKEFPDRPLEVFMDYYVLKNECDDFCCSNNKNNSNHVELLYNRVNLCKPNDIVNLGLDKYKIMQEIEKYFKTTFPAYIKNSKSPHTPHISLDLIKKWMEDKKFLEKINLSAEKIIHQIDHLNKYYAKLSQDIFKQWHINTDPIKKMKNSLFLGLYRQGEWIDRIIEMVINNIPPEKIHHFSASYRPKITKKLRKSVWGKHGNQESTRQGCFCCLEDIFYEDFECGHIIPLSLGGVTTIDNLEPICRSCNSDMGTMDLSDYKKLMEEQS